MGRVLKEETKQKRLEVFYQKAIKKAEAEIGNKYQMLTIIGVDYERTRDWYFRKKNNRIFVFTKCDCGRLPKTSTQLVALKTGHAKSCGCIKFNNPLIMEDLTGKKFGRLTVVARDIERDKKEVKSGKKRGNVHWLCRCDCGNPELKSVTGYQLKSGHTQSCGCYASEQIAARNKRVSTKINPIKETESTVILIDENGNECVVDKEDYPTVKNWYWRRVEKRGDIQKGYWLTNSKEDDGYDKNVIPLHQIIAEIKYGNYDHKEYMPDHLSRDTSDNRKCNILLKSNQENCINRGLSKANSSGKTGVSFNKDNQKWAAYITVNYKTKFLGYFQNKEDAIATRIKAEEKYGFTCDNKVAEYDHINTLKEGA